MSQFLLSAYPLWLVFYLTATVVALSIIVFVHEYGHFIVGRMCGVHVEAFSIGFGKELFGYTDRHGTRWKFSAIPLGGYVRFEGDANAASKPDFGTDVSVSPTGFHAQPVYKRALIVLAGPIANFILAIAIFWGAFALVGEYYWEPKVDKVIAGSAAEKAGIREGDRIISINGNGMESFEDVQRFVWLRAGEPLQVVIDRQGESIALGIVPGVVEQSDGFGGILRVGILGISRSSSADTAVLKRYGPGESLLKANERFGYVIVTTLKFLRKIVLGDQSVKQIGGIGTIAKRAGDAAASGPFDFVLILGLLSVSIGLINLFPVPMLDGGHLIFYAIEAVRGKPLGPTAQEWGYRIGLSFVAVLMVVGLFNDSDRFINHFFGT
jgi:regulator of sigma E protease